MREEDTYADLYLTVTLFLYATKDTCHVASKHARAYTVEKYTSEMRVRLLWK